MKKYIQFYCVLLFLTFIYSCNGQNNADQQKDKSAIPETKLPETDPYFTESKDIGSSIGPNSITRNMIQDKSGNFWFATWKGIIHYNVNYIPTGQPAFTNYTNKEGLRRFRVFTILEDSKGNIWFGTVGAGLYFYDGKTFSNINTNDGLVNNSVGCIMEDKAGNIWIGTQGGVSKYDGTSFTNFTTKEGLSNNDVNSIIEDKAGRFWFGTRGNTCFYDGKTFTQFTNKEGQPFVNVRSIIEDEKGDIWLGGNDGLWSYDGSSFTNYTKNFVGYIYQDRKKNIWTSSASSSNGNANNWVLSRYDKMSLQDNKVNPTQIKSENGMYFGIIEDKEGNIWLGTLNGVYRYNGISFDNFKD